MKRVFVICLLLLIVACSKEKELGNMVVQGQIKGLKKGTLYLQKMKDTVIFSVDSIVLLGNDTFTLTDNIDTSELYYLTLKGNNTQEIISFFSDEGTITINDKVDKYGIAPEIEGSKNQKVFDEYRKMSKRFQGKQLDLLAENLQAQKDKDLKKSESLRKKSESQIRKKYIYTINFALSHPDSEATAYITLTELVNSNVKYLDSINNSLTDRVKKSLYGKKLETFISNIKKTEI
tara:strand:+ start:7259 stop:7960 length:702 start_codon:yes stop_codon:yes gene_type:complete